MAQYQLFDFDGWPSGRYRTVNMQGSRPGGAVAAAWAVIRYLGREGYERTVEEKMKVTRALIEGINAIPGLSVLGDPAMCLFSYRADDVDTFAVADGMEARGWHTARGKGLRITRSDAVGDSGQESIIPEAIHMMIFGVETTPGVAEYLADLREVVDDTRARGLVGAGRTARYGST